MLPTSLLINLAIAVMVTAECYSTFVSFETPNPQITAGGLISKGFHFPGFALINDGPATQIPPNTGVFADTDPNIAGYGLVAQGTSSKYSPSIEVGADYSAFSLRAMSFACMQDQAGRSASLPAVNCGVTLTCIKPGGAKGGSQTLRFTQGGVRDATMQTANLDVDTFKCCESIKFATSAPQAPSGKSVATVIDTLAMYVTANHALTGLGTGGQKFCGCS